MPIGPANIAKYRLGPPSSIILDANTPNAIDLGSSLGGVTFTYSPTFFKAVPDQIIGAVAAWRTQEEGDIKFAMPEVSVNKLLAAFSYPNGAITTPSNAGLAAVTAGNQVANGASDAQSYAYSVFAYNSLGDGIPVACTPAISLGKNQLGATNNNTITFPAVLPAGAVGFGILRTTGGAATTVAAASNGYALPQAGPVAGVLNVALGTGFAAGGGTCSVVTTAGIQVIQYGAVAGNTLTGVTGGVGVLQTGGVVSQYGLGLIGRITQSGGLPATFTDTGYPATPYTGTGLVPSPIFAIVTAGATQPASPYTDTGYVGNQIAVPVHQLDLVIPKNAPNQLVASNLNWRWTFWSVVIDAATAIDWKRDKNSEYAITMGLLMNTSQPIGQQMFKMVEEYRVNPIIQLITDGVVSLTATRCRTVDPRVARAPLAY